MKSIKLEANPNIPIILLGNKFDVNDKKEVDKSEGLNWAKNNGDIPFFWTSAKENLNIYESF